MIEQNAAHAKHAVRFAIIPRELKSRDFAYAVGRARIKRCCLSLRHFTHLAEHFRGTRKIESAIWLKLPQGSEHVMRAVDVCIHRREAVSETLGDEALGRQVIALIKFVLADNVEDARITLQARGVQLQPIGEILNARESSRRIFERDSSDQAVNFIAQVEKMFRQIAAILAGDTCYQRCSHVLREKFHARLSWTKPCLS